MHIFLFERRTMKLGKVYRPRIQNLILFKVLLLNFVGLYTWVSPVTSCCLSFFSSIIKKNLFTLEGYYDNKTNIHVRKIAI